MMRYNDMYDLWITTDGQAYRRGKDSDKLILCKIGTNGKNHCTVHTKIGKRYLHRIVYETFNGNIPNGMVIDHKNNNPMDNSLDNLQCISHRLNCQLKFDRDGYTINTHSDFGEAFKAKYGIQKKDDPTLYSKERKYWDKHGRLS